MVGDTGQHKKLVMTCFSFFFRKKAASSVTRTVELDEGTVDVFVLLFLYSIVNILSVSMLVALAQCQLSN